MHQVGVLWYSVFGRLQYGYGTQQDLICILQASLASKAARLLRDDPERTLFICFSFNLSLPLEAPFAPSSDARSP